jgi:hypothetical protein
MQPFLICYIECQNETHISIDASENALTCVIIPVIKSTLPLSLIFCQDFILTEILWEDSGIGIFTYVCVFCLFQRDVGQSSEMQFCVVGSETGITHNSTLQCEHLNFVCLYLFFAEHTQYKISLCSMSQYFLCYVSVRWWKVFVFPMGLSVVDASFPHLVLRPWPTQYQCDNLNRKRWGG